MQQTKHVVIVAGEESGDLHAASFVKILKLKYPNMRFSGIGGHHMQTAGVELISDLARYGVTGVSEVIRHMGVIRRAFKAIKMHLQKSKPDLLVLVDYPGFNLRLAKFAKSVLSIRIVYYISPQIWAWKAGRIYTIRDYVDQMAVILPFEKKIYESAGVRASFVGHPLVNKITPCRDINSQREQLGLPINKRLIAMLPGSRINEIIRHMPVLQSTAIKLSQKFNDLHFVIPVAKTIEPERIHAYLKNTTIPYTLISGRAPETAACSDCVVVASGTASLECALLEKPMCIIYKGSALTYIAVFKCIKVKFLGLCNLLQNEMVVPELLQYDCNPIELTRTLTELLTDPEISRRMQSRLQQLKQSLSSEESDCSISELIEQELFLYP